MVRGIAAGPWFADRPILALVSPTIELLSKAALGALAVVLVAKKVELGRRGRWVLGGLALISVLAFFNFGTFHQVRFAHHGELFHYVLGSKYFPELGYDGLYVASLQAQRESAPDQPEPELVRDLRTNQKCHPRELTDHRREVRGRFTDERWQAFVVDHQYFLEHSSSAYLAAIRTDHGYNATPAWTAVARLVGGWLDVSEGSLLLRTLLDPLLLLLMFFVVWRTFGFVPAALSITVFGLAFLSRFHWVGGAFLRHDWLCASVVGICMLQRDRPVATGVAWGYAAAVRLFPALLLFGIAVFALRHWRRGDRRRWSILLGATFVATLVTGFFLGAAAGRGLEGWSELADAIELHRATWSRNRVGLFNSLMYGYDFLSRPLSTWGETLRGGAWQAKVDAFRAHFWPLRLAATMLMLGVVARAAWQRGRVESGVLGLAVIFALTEPSSYYWSILLAVPLLERRWLTCTVLGYSALLCLVEVTTGRSVVYGVAAHAMLGLLIAWSLWKEPPWRRPAGPSAPARVEAEP